MAADGQLHAMDLPGYWMDIGQPKDFITGIRLYLQSVHKKDPESLAPSSKNIRGHVLIHPTATVEDGCLIGPNVTIGPNVVIKTGT